MSSAKTKRPTDTPAAITTNRRTGRMESMRLPGGGRETAATKMQIPAV
jgi:hypothetical protein